MGEIDRCRLPGTVSVEFGTPERVEWHLDNWAHWMRTWEGVDGYDDGSAVLSTGGASQHFDDMVSASDLRCADIVNVIIQDMPHMEQAAVNHTYLAAVFRFRDHHQHLPALLASAKAKVSRGLKIRGVW